MKRLRLAALAGAGALAAIAATANLAQGPVPAASRDAAAIAAAEARPLRYRADHPGRLPFERKCAPCHAAGPGDDGAPMLPGTMALATKYGGDRPAALELRSDLGAEVLLYFVRSGSGAMPSFRKAELSDAEVEAIAGYLAATAKGNAAGQ